MIIYSFAQLQYTSNNHLHSGTTIILGPEALGRHLKTQMRHISKNVANLEGATHK